MELFERAAAQNLKDFVTVFQTVAPEVCAVWMECAGGVAAFTGLESPLTTVKGAGPEISGADIDAAMAFAQRAGMAQLTFELAPWVGEHEREELKRRGFEVVGAEDVVVRRLPCEMGHPAANVAEPGANEFAGVMWRGFELPDTELWRLLARAAAALPGAVNFGVRDGLGAWQACAQIAPCGGVAILGQDATLPEARGRGAQTALIQERLRRAGAMGLEWATAEVAPGSESERNYLRCGFEVAYRREHLSARVR